MKIFFYAVFITGILTSCSFNPDKKVGPAWQADILGPILKANLSLSNALANDIHKSKSVRLADFGGPDESIPVIIPPIPPNDLPPYEVNLGNGFASAEIEAGEMYFVITNELEIDVIAGAKMKISDTNDVFLDHPLPYLPALGGSYILTPKVNLAGRTLSANITIEVTNLSSNGSNGEVVMTDPERELTIDLYIKGLKIKSITAGVNNSIEIVDTVDFNIRGGTIDAETVSGTLNTYVKNGMPLDYSIQVYFLDENKELLDSLFEASAAIYAAPGPEAMPETKLVTSVTAQKNARLLRANYAVPALKLGASGPVEIGSEDSVSVQIVGDLMVNVNE